MMGGQGSASGDFLTRTIGQVRCCRCRRGLSIGERRRSVMSASVSPRVERWLPQSAIEKAQGAFGR